MRLLQLFKRSLILAVALLTGPLALAANFAVTKTADTADGTCDADCSLREAIIAANALAGSDTVSVPAGNYVLSRQGNDDTADEGDLDITDDLILTGAGAGSTDINGNGSVTDDRVIHVLAGTTASISGVTIRNGDNDDGGGIYNEGTLSLTNVTVRDNTGKNGGGIYSKGATTVLTLSNATVTGNTGDNGAGIYVKDAWAALTMTGGSITNNTTGGSGGGVYNERGAITLTGVTVSGNTAKRGGGVWSKETEAVLNITNSTFSQNTSNNEDGGAIFNDKGAVTIDTSTFDNNTGTRDGGALYSTNSASFVTITDTTFSSNQTNTEDGGAIFVEDSTLTLNRVTLNGNVAASDGGGLWTKNATTTLTNVTVSGNSAPGDEGGGIRAEKGVVQLNNVTLTNNSAGTGGGIFIQSDPISLFNTIVANSTSGGNCSGSITSLGTNLDSANTCGLSGTGDLTNTNPNLGTLQNNGGPTLTHALGTGSPAIDAGNNTNCPATDQRGVGRPIDGDVDTVAVCDIGAYEAPPAISADLGLTKTDSADPAAINTLMTYSLAVTNGGPDAATNVTLIDKLPATVAFQSATPSQGSGCVHSGESLGGTVTCSLGTVANGNGASVDTEVMAPATPGVISNSASVTADEPDPDPSDNAATEDTAVIDPSATTADLSLAISDSPDPVLVNQSLSYSLVVDNLGPDDATDVVLVDTLPATVALQSAATNQGSCVHSGEPLGGIVTCTLGTIANSADATVDIIVNAPSGGGIITNNASVSTSSNDLNATNNTASENTTVENLNVNQLCYLVADAGGGGGGNDLLTQIDTADFNPLTNETNFGVGTGTNTIEAIAWNSASMTLYAANAGQLGTLSTATGVFTALSSPFGTGSGAFGSITFTDVDGLTYDATTGVLYGSERQSGTDVLIQINMATGAHVQNAFGAGIDYVPLPPIGGNSITDDIAVDPTTGIMYAAVNSGGSTDRLIIINKETGATTDVALITVPDIEGLGTDTTGQLWGTSGTQGILYELNKATGVGSNGRPINNGSDYESVDCYAFSPSVVADLGVTKIVDDPAPPEGDTVTYTVTVTNAGPSTATVVQLSDALPAGVTFVSASPGQGTYDSATGDWFVGTVGVGANATLTLQASVDAATAGTTITNTAGVTYLSQNDPNAGNGSASADINPVTANVTVLKSAVTVRDPLGAATPAALAIPGAVVQYEILITNSGNGNATEVIVTDTLDENLTFLADDFNGGAADVQIIVGTEPPVFCVAETGGDTNSDGCFLNATGDYLTVTIPVSATYPTGLTVGTIAPNNVAVVHFRVTVN